MDGTQLRSQLEAGLTGRYTLERELGHGGMATVYLAQDLRHDRPVALKVLHPDLAQALGAERFTREIRMVARLQHPHILTVLDSGEAQGQLWFTMPYVEGESLRGRLERERQLPLEDALRIARETADALSYAHAHGVVHRDIKPENILLSGGHALVADFGIARALDAGGRLTETGMAVGTPAYMSPEQASAEPQLDGRTDIYSLAAVLYEMLAGEPPYTGPTAQAVVAKRFSDPVPSVRRVRASVSEAVDQAIKKALAPISADRFGTAAQFGEALQPSAIAAAAADGSSAPDLPSSEARTVVPASGSSTRRRKVPIAASSLVLGLLTGLGVLFGWRQMHRTGDTIGAQRLAVLPFENLGAADQDYFADGMTDEVRGKLAAVPGLRVIARSSSSQYKKTSKTPQQIGQELGTQYLLTATVRWEKDATGRSRVRLSPELVNASDGTTKWQQPFEADLSDVFHVQADIAGRVAQALDVALEASARRSLEEKPTQNLEAYDAYLKGEEISDGVATGSPAVLRRAIVYYQQAVTLDPAFAPAWAQLSRAHSLIYGNSTPLPAEAEQARIAAERALALAPNRPEGHVAMGMYYQTAGRGEYARALQEFAQGERATPNNAELLSGRAAAEQGLGQWDQALEHLRKAQALDPRSVEVARRLVRTLLFLRRYPEAREAGERARTLAPANLSILEDIAMIHLAQADLSGARVVLESAPRQVDHAALVAFLGQYWDLCWVLDDEEQRQLLRFPPSAFDDDRGNWGLALAQTYFLRGDTNLGRAYADSARLSFEGDLRRTPDDPAIDVLHGVALAYLGRKAEAESEGERSLAIQPLTKDAYGAAYNQHQLVRIYIMVGEPEKALDLLEPLLKIPYYLSPGWLRIDPTFDPLRKNPRFMRLVAAG